MKKPYYAALMGHPVCVCVYTHYMYAHFHDIIIVGLIVFVNPNTFPRTDQLTDAKEDLWKKCGTTWGN